jgi:hypothetical protein
MGTGGITLPFFISAVDGGEWPASRPGRFTPAERTPAPTAQEVGCAPQPVWTLWRRELLALPEIEPRLTSQWLVAIPTELFRLLEETVLFPKTLLFQRLIIMGTLYTVVLFVS